MQLQRAQNDFRSQLSGAQAARIAAAAENSTAEQQRREAEVGLESAAKAAKDTENAANAASRRVNQLQGELRQLQDRQGACADMLPVKQTVMRTSADKLKMCASSSQRPACCSHVLCANTAAVGGHLPGRLSPKA